MLSSCPKIISCKFTKQIGEPSPYKRMELQQELNLKKESPMKFRNVDPEKEIKHYDYIKIIPIKDLNTSSGEDWHIKARVRFPFNKFQITKKGNIISYQAGRMFKIEIVDVEGTQIEGTFYKDCLDFFFNKIEEGKIYTFTQAQIANANKKFTSVKNDFRIIFNQNSVITDYIEPKKEESKDSTNTESESEQILRYKFNFVSIFDIMTSIHDLKQIDVCGINVTKDPKKDDIDVKFDYGKKTLKGRLVFTLVDNTNEVINVNLWGDLSNIEINEGDIVIINGARVSTFGGKSLNCGSEYCKIIINPTREEVSDIDRYVDLSNANLVAKHRSAAKEQQVTQLGLVIDKLKEDNQKLISDVLDELNCGYDGTFKEHSEVYRNPTQIYCLQGNIIKFVSSSDSMTYMGCPICCKKVYDHRLTGYYCSTCGKIIKEKFFYFIHAIFQDFTGKIIIGFSKEQADILMGNVDPLTFIKKIKKSFRMECDFEGWLNENIYFKTYKILVKAKNELYQGTNRIRFHALDVVNISTDQVKASFRNENLMLLGTLQQQSKIRQKEGNLDEEQQESQ
ncbi:replication protein a 70 kda dna-binding subunit-like [Stylonychia lemnae]|uniref:Replication protein a 70 kDa dna-binding subunit-like n=1 Tax=Stylonychia lemnae TaxID=5949 RepID=A0A078ANW1_STYLE|nr:replication protein a 70 kda dna-binding subunit-like [Stylonychia lemnae]|eukprot:CDW83621.1 replication protein a 70 kda dna-binding subunit-like [Stylonychia lemnae]